MPGDCQHLHFLKTRHSLLFHRNPQNPRHAAVAYRGRPKANIQKPRDPSTWGREGRGRKWRAARSRGQAGGGGGVHGLHRGSHAPSGRKKRCAQQSSAPRFPVCRPRVGCLGPGACALCRSEGAARRVPGSRPPRSRWCCEAHRVPSLGVCRGERWCPL